MMTIHAKSLKDKLDLFIKLADQDGNGFLNEREVFDLCKVCLIRFFKGKEGEKLLESLSSYFTKFIFNTCGVDLLDPSALIPLETIKELILSVRNQMNQGQLGCWLSMETGRPRC